MAQRVRIQCINKSDRNNAWNAIGHVGGVNADGTRWKLTLQAAVEGAEAGKWQFYVERPPGDPVNVVVMRSPAGNKYLKTVADGDRPNNLLSLPECPIS